MKRTVLICCVVTLLVGAVAFGQTTRGAIKVTIADADGRVLPGTMVSVQSPEALGTRSTVADASGVAIVPGLDPSGEYMVTVSLSGFNTARFENILVKSGSTTSIAAELSVAAVEAEIIVTAESPLVDFSSAMTGEDLTLELMEALPTGRSYQSYLQLVPGVMPTDPSIDAQNPAVRSGLNYADIGGNLGRSRDNFYYIEGIDVTDAYDGYFGANLNVEIIQEQSVTTGGIPAEFVGAPGLVSSVITKSGGNEFHGSVNYFFQNDSLQEDNEHLESSTFSTYDAAFTLGGPFMRDKAWFFASYRLLNRDQDVSSTDTGEYMRTVNSSANQAFAKLSWSPAAPVKLTGTFLSDPTESDGQLLSTVQNTRDRTEETGGDRYILNYSHVLGPAYLSLSGGMHNGEFSHYASNQETYNQVYFNTADDFTSADEQLGGYGTDIEDQRDNIFAKGSFEWYLGSSWGDHTLSFGVEYMDHERYTNSTYTGDGANWSSYHNQYAGMIAGDLAETGDWTGVQWRTVNVSDVEGLFPAIDASPNAAQHYAILDTNGDGEITPEELAVGMVFGSTEGNPNGMLNYYRIVEAVSAPVTYNSKGMTYYAQDSWQLKNFTVNAGVRAEQWDHYATDGSKISEFDLDVAPRLGVVWDVTGRGKMKVSAFYGRYYDPIRMNMTSFAGTLIGRERHEQVWTNFEWLTYRIRGGTQTQDALFSPTTQTPYTDDFQLGFEVDLGANMSFEALVIRRKTRDIMEDYDLCLYAYCTDGTTYYDDINHPDSLWLGLEYFGYDENPGSNFVIGTLAGGKRDWDGIELVFRKRFANRWQGLASYTYADAMGNSNSDSNADFQGDVLWIDPRAPHQWARQPGMIEHLFKMGGSYSFDFGLQLGGTFAYNSGTVASRTWSIYRRNLPLLVDEAYEWGGMLDTWLTPDAVGSLTNPSWYTFDLRGTYTFNLGSNFSLELFLDVFNVLDDQATVRNQDVVAGTGGTDFGEALQWVSPRRLYLGARLNF
jgi:hypothetical protein